MNIPVRELKPLLVILNRCKDLVLKCNEISSSKSNYFAKWSHGKKLKRMNRSLVEEFHLYLSVIGARDLKLMRYKLLNPENAVVFNRHMEEEQDTKTYTEDNPPDALCDLEEIHQSVAAAATNCGQGALSTLLHDLNLKTMVLMRDLEQKCQPNNQQERVKHMYNHNIRALREHINECRGVHVLTWNPSKYSKKLLQMEIQILKDFNAMIAMNANQN